MKRKGFTLIELIVVMAIMGILILLGSPKYKEYSNEAQSTKIKVNVKELETASSQYYIRHNAWPRLGDEPYNAEQIEEFSKKILDKTGSIVSLDSEGNYYDIDYNKVSNYIKISDDMGNYILQNPLGSVFYMQGITEKGKDRISTEAVEEVREPVVWANPSATSNIEIHSNGLGATNKVQTHNVIRATEGKIEGKWYWEITHIRTVGYKGVGVAVTQKQMNANGDEKVINTWGDIINQSIMYYTSTFDDISYTYNYIFKNGVQQYTGIPIKQNDVISVLLDATNKEIEIRNNNRLIFKGKIIAQEGIELYPTIDLFNSSVIANFGVDKFKYEVPEGYLPYDYSNAFWFK